MESLSGGGAEKVLIDILRNFDYTNFNVHLLLLNKKGVYLKDIPNNVSVRYLFDEESFSYIITFKLLRRLNLSWLMKKYVSLFTDSYYDTIISFMEARSLRVHNYLYKRASRNVSWIHCDLKNMHWSKTEFLSFNQELEAYRKMDKVVVVSRQLVSSINSLFKESIVTDVVLNLIDSVNIQRYERDASIGEYLSFCCVGRLAPEKRFDRIIYIANRLKSEGRKCVFNVIGQGELFDLLKKNIEDAGLEEMVLLRGFVSPPYELMAECDVFISTSDHEGYPLAVCEALCLGLPVISTDIVGSHEILYDEASDTAYGILVENNKVALYEAVKDIIDNPQHLDVLKRLAIQRREMFDVGGTMEKIYSII